MNGKLSARCTVHCVCHENSKNMHDASATAQCTFYISFFCLKTIPTGGRTIRNTFNPFMSDAQQYQ